MTYKLYDENGNLLNECGELEAAAFYSMDFVYAIPHSSTPLLRLYPLEKCFRCCLPSLQSGLNWSWYVPTPYYNFAGNCNQHHTHIHIRSACAGTQTYSSCRMLWIWCWGCTAHHRWDKIALDWCGFDLPFLPLPFSLLGTKNCCKMFDFYNNSFQFLFSFGHNHPQQFVAKVAGKVKVFHRKTEEK